MRNIKLVGLPMLVILGLLMSGFAYACWSQTLYIEGSVASGELDWEFVAWSCLDQGVDWHCRDGFAGPPPLFWLDPQGKNVGWQELIPKDTDGDGDYDTLELNLHNVYPSYFTSVSVYAHNNGSIPLIIDNVIINGVVLREWPTPVVRLDLNDDEFDDIEIWWGDGFGAQLEPCSLSPEMSFWVHVLENAPQNEDLSFTISLVAVQYNVVHPPVKPITITMTPNRGRDETHSHSLTSDDLGKLASSDNNYYTTKKEWDPSYSNTEYLEFGFPSPIPSGATIESVILTFEWQRGKDVNNARILVWDTDISGWREFSLWPLPVKETDRTETIDLSAYITSPAEVNALKIWFQATGEAGGHRKTKHDLVSVSVTYIPP